MVDGNRYRCAVLGDVPFQGIGDDAARHRKSDLYQRTLATPLIDDREHANWLSELREMRQLRDENVRLKRVASLLSSPSISTFWEKSSEKNSKAGPAAEFGGLDPGAFFLGGL
jgi:hypothetical protein